MSERRLLPKVGVALTCLMMTACVSRGVENSVPDFVLQHTLSALTNEQSFAWDGSSGEAFVIRPLGTFRNGDRYCRDYEIGREDLTGKVVKRTACRFNERWTDVDQSNLGT